MTSRKYNSIANEFACELRQMSDSPTNSMKAGAWRIIGTWMRLEQKTNPRFDPDRFVEYINERIH